jgi:hypothetical protein
MNVAGREMLSEYETEQVGISTEIAIADLSGVQVDAAYRNRGKQELVEHIKPAISPLLSEIPKPISHVAMGQNSVDFTLEGNLTLSVKSNMKDLGKVAPQILGQPTDKTFWEMMVKLVPSGIDTDKLSYEESARLFKQVSQENIVELLAEYWKLLFHCDYLIWVYDVVKNDGHLSSNPRAVLYEKAVSPDWDRSKITFTKNPTNWNESCTIRYSSVSIGEFQVHNNRNCFKFRFNGKGLSALGLI